MKATDLRIGNLIGLNDSEWDGFNQFFDVMDSSNVKRFLEDKNKHASIISIGKEIELMAYGCDLDYYSIDEIEPIQLTEEWLFGFGFTIDRDSWFYSLDYDKNKDTFKVCQLFKDDNPINKFSILNCRACELKIEYVHQLQNVFYWHTGEELTQQTLF